MDFADIGADATENFIEDSINRARASAAAAAESKLTPTGSCRNIRCGDDTTKLFCSTDCRDEYERLKKRMQ